MEYNEIFNKGQLEESKDNVLLQESKYCEAVMNMLDLLDEQEQLSYIASMPAHLQETSLKQQAKKMSKKIKDISPEVDNLYKVIKRDRYINEMDKKDFLEKLDNIKNMINENIAIFNDKEFQDWYNKIDSNSGFFGVSKDSALPSRRSLGL